MSTSLTINQSGILLIGDDDIPGNGTGAVRDQIGNIISTFAYPDSLRISTVVSGATLNFDLIQPNHDLIVGDPPGTPFPLLPPDAIGISRIAAYGMRLVANNAIAEWGDDAAVDIEGVRLVLSAGSGIGASNAIETEVAYLEAETVTGNIGISNSGTLTIVGVSPYVEGLSVEILGSIDVMASGSIWLNDASGSATVRSGAMGGDVTLTAVGMWANIGHGGDNDAIVAPSGNIALNASNDISFGGGASSDVAASGSIAVNAGRYFTVDINAKLTSDAFDHDTGGDVTINAPAGIFVAGSSGSGGAIGAKGAVEADVILNTQGFLSLRAPSPTAVSSTSGNVIASADQIFILSTSGITADNGAITLKPFTSGRLIDLGNLDDTAAALTLSDAELDRLFTSKLIIGGPEAGTVTVSANITPANAKELTIESDADIVIGAGVLVQVEGALVLRAGSDIVVSAGARLDAPNGIVGYVDVGSAGSGGGGETQVDPSFMENVTFIGNLDGDTLFGGAGNDTLRGGAGNDLLDGGAGAGDWADYVDKTAWVSVTLFGASDAIVTVDGTAEDTIRNIENVQGGSAGDVLAGDGQANELRGLEGNDVLRGGGGHDVLDGGAGWGDWADYIGKSAAVFVKLNGTNDVFVYVGGVVEDTLRNIEAVQGGSGNDVLVGDGLGNELRGLDGNDVLRGSGGFDVLDGGVGWGDWADYFDVAVPIFVALNGASDAIVYAGGVVEDTIRNIEAVQGGVGNDVLVGDGFGNELRGLDGNDVLRGGGGFDVLDGGVGWGDWADYFDVAVSIFVALNGTSDAIVYAGGVVEDAIRNIEAVQGGASNDVLVGDSFGNELRGLDGNDVLRGGGGHDVLDGGAGWGDWADYIGETAALVVVLNGAGDVIVTVGGVAEDTIYNIEAVQGGSGYDVLFGDNFGNELRGMDGGDVLSGGDGNDTLMGGRGSDQFFFNTPLNEATNVDAIIDFDVGADSIVLENAIFSTIGGAGMLTAAQFAGNATGTAQDADDRIIYDTNTGNLYYDSNGDTSGGGILFAHLTPGLILSNEDFFVV